MNNKPSLLSSDSSLLTSGGNAPEAEALLTLKAIAEKLGLPTFKVTRAAKAGFFPTYSIYNKRKLARLSEVLMAVEATRTWGRP